MKKSYPWHVTDSNPGRGGREGASDAAQTWDVFLPLESQYKPSSWWEHTENIWQVVPLRYGQSRVTLMVQHGSDPHQVVCTKSVKPFQAHVGSMYIVLGELQLQQDGDSLVKALVLNCVEGMDLPL
ncbi:hypothetical protein P7K49_001032 [Saguinus oedipus]|uniref:Uncharacterized protein n=1 Tax=Saguinus oedipus TaxID=9490 RepID=A0ABQ9WEB3_SAGOE|nr:hypothetical protein P7K49_001032 [Saguinus oedipus]